MRKRTTIVLSFIALIVFALVMWKDFNVSNAANSVDTVQEEVRQEELESETKSETKADSKDSEELSLESQETDETITNESAKDDAQESTEEFSEGQEESYEIETYEAEKYEEDYELEVEAEYYESEYEAEPEPQAEPQPEPEPEPQPEPESEPQPETEDYGYSGDVLNPYIGVVDGPSGRETYYNLPMEGVIDIMRSCGYDEANYPYWVREDGVKMLGGYVMCAANLDIRPRGTVLASSLGTAIVCDTGSFAYGDPYQLDIAVSW